MITDRMKFTTKYSPLRDVLFLFLPSELIQNHSPGLYITHKKGTYPIFRQCLMSDIALTNTPLCGLVDRHGRKADLNWKLKISNMADNADITQSQHVTLGIVKCRK